ncbi:NAD-P-binding protein [Trametes cingulata]|nr:NAD-P-binding protein [Trametes cingulata]
MSSTARPTTWLVTGASRGIGFELVRQLLESSDNLVVATCRTPEKATALNNLKSSAKGTLHIIKIDVSDFDSIRASAKQLEPILGEIGLDYLINNAGIGGGEAAAFALDPEEVLTLTRTNAVGPALLAQICLPFLEKGKRKVILNISSTAGSVASAGIIGARFAAYSISKAALNMLTYKQKLDRPDLITIALCPGWVKTDMGGKEAALEPKDSVADILKIITSATPADSGKYLRHNGEEIPW